MRHLLSACIAAALILVTAAPAFAHAHLRQSTPAADSVAPAPAEVSITFSEALEPKFSSITVSDPSGARVDQGSLHVVGDNARVVAIGLKPLPPGVYSVDWHATSVDSHKTEGKFTFTVAK
eukprot:gene12889-12989_t